MRSRLLYGQNGKVSPESAICAYPGTVTYPRTLALPGCSSCSLAPGTSTPGSRNQYSRLQEPVLQAPGTSTRLPEPVPGSQNQSQNQYQAPRTSPRTSLRTSLREPVRILPLGSPTGQLKRSYVHVPSVLATVSGTVLVDVRAGWRTRGGAVGGIPGGCYTGYYPAMLHWYCQGPTISHSPRYLRPPGTPSPCWALRTPGSSHSAYAPLLDNRARFHQIYLKVSPKPGVSTK